MVATPDEDVDDLIRMHVLGASEIQIGRKKVTLSTEVVFALGFYLCARAGERLTRADVTEIFWGEGREAQSRHSLRQMLYRLRQKGLTLDEESEELYLDPARVDSDLARALADDWPVTADAAAIEAAGAFAPGFTRFISERFQAWLDGVKDRLAAQHRRGALQQIALARREGRWADLERWALQVMRSDPLNEEATLARAESAAMAGSKSVALEIIDAYMEELGDRAAVIGLPATILRRRIAERRTSWARRDPIDVPLVGRLALMSRLTGFVDATANGAGSAVVLWGAPGIGKTRLAEETRAYADLSGFRTVAAHATVAHSTRPLSVLLSLVPLLLSLPGAAGCDPAARAILDRTLQQRSATPDFDPAASIESIRDSVLAAIQDLLEAVTEESKLLLLVDDLQNVDAVSLELIGILTARTHMSRMMWIGTSRAKLSDLQQTGIVSTTTLLRVPPLTADDSKELARAFVDARAESLPREIVTTVAHAADGNPLFVRELSAHQGAGRQSDVLPSSLRELMNDRLAILDPAMLRCLRVATLLGHLASLPRLQALHRSDAVSLSDTVEKLEAEGILRIGPNHSLDLHECWQQAVSESLTGITRAALAMECARCLVEGADVANTDLHWAAADLFGEAGDTERATALLSSCAHRLHIQGFPEEAATTFRRALLLTRREDERFPLLSDLASALHSAQRLEEVVACCTEALSLAFAASVSGQARNAVLLCLRMDALSRLHLDHRDDLARLTVLAGDRQLSPDVRQLVCLYGIRAVFNDRSSDLEDSFLLESTRISAVAGDSTIGLLVQLIHATERGQSEEMRRLDALLAAAEGDLSSTQTRLMALRYRAQSCRLRGDQVEARGLAERCFVIASTSGMPGEAAAVSQSMVFGCLDTDDLSGAASWLERLEASKGHGINSAREQAYTHAKSRLLMQQGDYQAALDTSTSQVHSPLPDLFAKRRAGELATVALCAVTVGSTELGRRALEQATKIIGENRPSKAMDYATELVLRTLRALGSNVEADDLRRRYSSERCGALHLPVPPFYVEIHRHFGATDA